MAFEFDKEFDLKRIQKAFDISQKSIDNSQIDEHELEKIYHDFQSSGPRLDKIRAEILSTLNEELTGKIHSIRCRVKDPDHLIEKIIRNVNKNPDKYKSINADNYNKIITDLIGVRIIILDKRDWRDVHNSLLRIFRNLPERYVTIPEDIITNYDKYSDEANIKRKFLENSYHAEKPVVYITSEEDRELYWDENLRIDNSKSHYRSVHYIIRYATVYFEIQVRTLFEEGWLEFDHRIKYPYDQNNRQKQEYIGILSSLAVAADRLISFYEESAFQQENFMKKGVEKKEPQTISTDHIKCEPDLHAKMRVLF
ncbi:MAG: RelA/SpoT domain-containing protein [Lachnospiraceae bacterium]|nr:RelA/SpoT domain-containing protein [Lachnospiraceae bacterium]